MANIGLIIAGGSGNRMHQDIPKQFITVNERPVIVYTLEAFEKQHDQLYKSDVLDVTSDVRVLETLLKQDGLLESEMKAGAAKSPEGQAQSLPM